MTNHRHLMTRGDVRNWYVTHSMWKQYVNADEVSSLARKSPFYDSDRIWNTGHKNLATVHVIRLFKRSPKRKATMTTHTLLEGEQERNWEVRYKRDPSWRVSPSGHLLQSDSLSNYICRRKIHIACLSTLPLFAC